VRSGRSALPDVKHGTLVNIHTDQTIKVPRITYRIQFQPADGLKKKLKLGRVKHWKYLNE
jgi:hypothetical protein